MLEQNTARIILTAIGVGCLALFIAYGLSKTEDINNVIKENYQHQPHDF